MTLLGAFVAGWVLTALLQSLFSDAIRPLPVSLQAVVVFGTALLGGAAAAVPAWRLRLEDALARFLEGRAGGETPGPPDPARGMRRAFGLVTVGLTLFALVPIGHGLDEFLHHRWLGSFRPAEATVTGTRIDEVSRGGLNGLAPRVLYLFRVGNESYTGYKVHWDLDLPGEGGWLPPPENVVWGRDEQARKTLADLLERYPAGKAVTAYHDPDRPENACLVYVPFQAGRHGSGLWFGLIFVTFAWSLFAVVWQVSRARAQPAPPPSLDRSR